jgi:hypothetical protein
MSEVATSATGSQCSGGGGDYGGVCRNSSILKLDLDGLDQAKGKLPRNLANSKQLEKLWRPQMHIVGFIAWGVCNLQLIGPAMCFLVVLLFPISCCVDVDLLLQSG